MVFNYICEVESVRDRQKEFISKVLEKKGFKECDVLIEPVGKAGDNYVANVQRIIVNHNGETFKMIAKVAPDNVMMRQVANFRELQVSAGVPEKDWFRHAECYGTFMEAPNEIILLEDLKASKFDILDRFKQMTNECVKLVLKNFAIYHSLSLVFNNKEPETLTAIKSKFVNAYDQQNPDMEVIRKQWTAQMEESAIVHLEDEKHRLAVSGSTSKLYKLSEEIEKLEFDSNYSVIQQGDGWTNNIMFILEDDQPSQCVLIDYQMAKFGNPMYDIMYMIFNSTDTDQRIQHYSEFIDYYYSELDKSLNIYGLLASELYPRSQLDVDMKRSAKLVIAASIVVSNLITKDVANASKLQDVIKNSTEVREENIAAMMEHTTESQELFRSKVQGLARSFVELGLL